MSSRLLFGIAGLGVLTISWMSALPRLASGSFASHMLLHMLVVSVAMPVIALALTKTSTVQTLPTVFPLTASLVDFVIIWVWHLPALHMMASQSSFAFVLQQASFATAALFVWWVALGASPLAGALELFFTSMHMVLLGALITLAPRTLYNVLCLGGFGLDPLTDQQLGGATMLTIGGSAYLVGGLLMMRGLLHPASAP